MKLMTTKKALLATAVSSAMVASAGIAQAGGPLEEVPTDDLIERIERLEKIIGPGKDFAVRSGTSKVRVELNGQVNQKFRYANDGIDDGYQILDNDGSSTRFRILGTADLNDTISAGTAIELDLEGNVSSQVDLQDQDFGEEVDGGSGTPNFDFRKLEVFFKHKGLGTIFLGQGTSATDGVTEKDLSGTGVSQDSDSDDSALDFRDAAGNFTLDVGDIGFNLDGASRDNRIRYDTPRFAGFQLRASLETRTRFDIGLHYATKDLAGFDIAAGAGFVSSNGGDAAGAPDDRDNQFSGSLSVLHRGTGLSLTGAAGTTFDNDVVEEESTFYFGKVGWKGNLVDFGSTAVSFSYHFAEVETDAGNTDFAVGTTLFDDGGELFDGRFFTVSAVQKVDKLSAEIFARYTNYSADASAAFSAAEGIVGGLDDINVVAIGSRIKF